MEDDATQPSTQRVTDPRRIGTDNSGLNRRDVADVLAILHPASEAALKVVEEMANCRRQHVLLRNPYDSFDDCIDIEEQETIRIDRPETRLDAWRSGADLALRMSSKLADEKLGFVFGRNPKTDRKSTRLNSSHWE